MKDNLGHCKRSSKAIQCNSSFKRHLLPSPLWFPAQEITKEAKKTLKALLLGHDRDTFYPYVREPNNLTTLDPTGTRGFEIRVQSCFVTRLGSYRTSFDL